MSQSTGEQSQALANPNQQEQVPDTYGSLDTNSQTEPRVRTTTRRYDPSTPLRPPEQSTVRCNITRAGGGAGGNGGRGQDRAGSPELPNLFKERVETRGTKRRNVPAEMPTSDADEATPGKKRGQRRAAGGGVVGDGGEVRTSRRLAGPQPGDKKSAPILVGFSSEEEDLSDVDRRRAAMPAYTMFKIKVEKNDPEIEVPEWSQEPKKLFEKVSIREPQLFPRAGGMGFASKPHDGGGELVRTFAEHQYPWKLRRQLQNLSEGRDQDVAALVLNPTKKFTGEDVQAAYKDMVKVVRVNEAHQIGWTDEQREAADAAFKRLGNARTNLLAEFSMPNAEEVREFMARPEGETAQPLARESLIFDHIGDAMARAGGADGGADGGAAALPTPPARTTLEQAARAQALAGMHSRETQARATERDGRDAAGTAAPRVDRRILGPLGLDRLRATGASGDVPAYIAVPYIMAEKRRLAEEEDRDAQGGSGAGGIARPAKGTADRRSAAKKKSKGTAFYAPNAFKAFGKTSSERRAEKKRKQDLKDWKVACRAANRWREVYLQLDADEKATKAEKYELEYENQKAYVEFLKKELDDTDRKRDPEWHNTVKKLWKRNDYRLDKLVLKMNKVLGGTQALDAYHKGLMSAYEKLIYGKTADTDNPVPLKQYVKFLAEKEETSDRDEDVGYDGKGFYVWKCDADEDDEEDVPEQDEDDEEDVAADDEDEDEP